MSSVGEQTIEKETELPAEANEDVEEREDIERLRRRMEEVKLSTEAENTVKATITDVRPEFDDGTVTVEFQLPTGQTHEEKMPIPQTTSTSYKFVRVCHAAGAGIDSFDELLLDERVTVTRKNADGEWRIHAPDTKTNRLRRIPQRLAEQYRRQCSINPDDLAHARGDFFFTIIAFPLMALVSIPESIPAVLNDYDGDNVSEFLSVATASATLGAMLWGGIAATALLFLV